MPEVLRMRKAVPFLLVLIGAAAGALLFRAIFRDPVDSGGAAGRDEIRELRSQVDALSRQVNLLRDCVNIVQQQSTPGDKGITATRTQEASQSVLAIEFERRRPLQRDLAAILWRCLHDKDGVIQIVEDQHLSPFDSGVLEVVEMTYSRLDDLRSRNVTNADALRTRRAIADALEAEITSGRVKGDQLAQLHEQIDHLRNSEDLAARELETARNVVLQDMVQQLEEVKVR